MLMELCAMKYETSNGLVNGADGIFEEFTKTISKIFCLDTFSYSLDWT
jgi:hypothetical protein